MLAVRVSLAVHGKPLVDNYVFVDDSVRLRDLIDTALTLLGFGHLADSAQGFIQVANWKPLTLEQISDDHDQPTAKLLKPIAYGAMLKIVVGRDQPQAHSSAESTTTSPVSKKDDGRVNVSDPRLSDSDTVDNDSEDGGTGSASDPGCSETMAVQSSTQQSYELPATLEQMLHQFLQHQGPLFDAPASSVDSVGHYEPEMTRSPSPDVRRYDPKERPVKPCFDIIYEVPMLQRWYSQLKFPGKAQCQLYADKLNSLAHRKTSPTLSWMTVSNWFKNRRRQDRRKEVMSS